MRYVTKRALEVARFFMWWRLALIVVTVALAVLAVTSDTGAGWFAAAAAVPALILYGVGGTRTATNHAEVKKLREVVAGTRTVATSAPKSPPATKARTPAAGRQPLHRPARPDVTIVVTAFNERDYIIDCLGSIQDQTWTNFECIVIDDQSTDDTVEIAFDAFSPDGRFEFVTLRSNAGLSAARNVGIGLARAPWITFVDGDDFLFEGAIEQRLATLASETANPWVAGAYCNWVPVPQNQQRTATGKDLPGRKKITWLNALHDAPFIASAPIVRTEVMRALGGFRDVNAAEDADMWTKVLRHGYVFLPTHYTGVAYRQKSRSMFRSEVLEHASVTTGLYVDNYRPQPLTEFVPDAPFPFCEAAPTYITAVESFRRNLIALTTAVAQDSTRAIEQLRKLLDDSMQPYLPVVVDVDAVILHAAKRSESYEHVGAATRAQMLASKTTNIVAPLVSSKTPGQLGTTDQSLPGPCETTRGTLNGVEWARLAKPQRLHLSSEATGTSLRGRVVLMPSAAYHVKELGPLAKELDEQGIPVAFMVSDRRWDWAEPGLRSWGYPVYAFPDDMAWTREIGGIVTLNDWGEKPHEAILAANDFGVPTFGKVEGVQDFDDVDVHWTRNAYQTAAYTLCQGTNDQNALPESVSTHVVGSSRLEDIWTQPPRKPGPELAVVNLNFTYGVLEDARQMWVDTVLDAANKVGIPMVFSLHPAEKHHPAGAVVSDLPISHLLTEASVLISRFSTVPFEAMARGVPFVYHNPHDERVPTFLDPQGAYELSMSADELAAAIVRTRSYADSYRPKCEVFFRQQIDIDESISAAKRAAAFIEGIVTGRR